jgi:alcohol dehydrogenase class IV
VLDRFIASLDMPRSLGTVKATSESFDQIAEQAMGTVWMPHNPRPVDGPVQLREILELAA